MEVDFEQALRRLYRGVLEAEKSCVEVVQINQEIEDTVTDKSLLEIVADGFSQNKQELEKVRKDKDAFIDLMSDDPIEALKLYLDYYPLLEFKSKMEVKSALQYL